MKFYITQQYTPEYKELYGITGPICKSYAEKNGFGYIYSDKKRCPDRKIWWEKIAWLIELLPSLEEGALVIYLDSDSIGIGGDPKTILHEGFEYGMVQLRGGMNNSQLLNWYNAGVIAMRNTQSVRDFLKRVWDRNDDTDETSINKELQSAGGSIGKSKKICSLEVSWNSWGNNEEHSKEIWIKSWHGIQYAEKISAIKSFLQ